MVFNQTQNTVIKNNLIDELKLNPSVDNIPNVVNPTIQPVFEVKKKFVNFSSTNSTASLATAVTVHTASSTLDTYVTSLIFSLAKDATNDTANVAASIQATIAGTASTIAAISTVTLTETNQIVQISFNPPLKLDRGTTVRFTSPTFAAGTLRESGTVAGYTEETAIKTT